MNNNRIDDILIVDNNTSNLGVLRQMLVNEGYQVRAAIDGETALLAVKQRLPQLILLDIMMPEMDGFEVCAHLKANPKTVDVPVIFISALNTTEDKVKGLELGAVDFITKPFQIPEVKARVKTHLTLYHQKQEIERLTIEREKSRLVGNFVRDTSHDLRTPLSVINNCAYIIEKTTDPNKRTERVKKIRQQVQVLENILNRMNELIELQGDLVINKGQHLLKSFFTFPRDILILAEKKEIYLTAQASEASIFVDEMLLSRAIYEIIQNALLYTPNGGSVDIQAGVDADNIVIVVADSGLGIASDDLPYIFDPLYKTNEARTTDGSSAGLGLAIAKKIINLHDGEIDVSSASEQGSVVHITIPMHN